MKNTIFGILFVILFSTIAKAENKKEIIINKEISNTVVLIGSYVTKDINFYSSCAGVWIGKKHIITADHCLPSYRVFNKELPNDEEQSSSTTQVLGLLTHISYDNQFTIDQKIFAGSVTERVTSNKACDLMVLRADDPILDHIVTDIRYTPLKVGENVSTVGHPGLLSYVYTQGTISKLDVIMQQISPLAAFNLININIGEGNSGGGLFDEQGRLTGIATALTGQGGATFGLYSNQMCLREFLMQTKQVEKDNGQVW